MAYMAQIAQKRLYFEIGATSTTENDAADVFIDIAACLTAVNRKQYHQVTKSGDPLCYTVTVTNVTSAKPLEFCTAPNTWTTKNAAKKTAVGWKEQMKNSSIRMSELPTYARRFRCAYDLDAVGQALDQGLTLHLVPDGCDGSRLFTPYDAPDGSAIDYFNSNEVVYLAVDDTMAQPGYKPHLIGATAGDHFGMISEYLKSRRNMREESDPTTEFPDSDGLMNSLFATSEELADEVTGAVAGYNIARPYSEDNAYEAVKAGVAFVDSAMSVTTFSVPLGLIKITGYGQNAALTAGDRFFVDVEAVYEM